MPPKKGTLTALAGAAILTSLVCLGLYAYHARTHCFSQVLGISTFECTREIVDICTAGYAVSASGTIQGADWKASITCSFRASTTISGIFGCIAAFALIVFFCSIGPGRDQKTRIAVCGGLSVLLLLLSSGLMIGDVKNGANHHKNGETKSQAKLDFSPGSYITNIFFAFAGIVLAGLITFFGYKAEGTTFGGSGVTIGSSIPNQQQENELSDMSEGVVGGPGVGSQTRKGYTMFN